MPNVPYQLRDAYTDGRLIAFIGAGVSMSVSWTDPGSGRKCRGPSWEELIDQAALDLGFENPALARVRGSPLQILEYHRIKHHGVSARLTNWLIKTMQAPRDALENSPIHKELAKLDNVRLFYTTNFDDFLERSFTILGRKHKVVAVEADMATSDSNACEVIKFHGDINHPNDMVLSESDYDKRLSFLKPMDFRLRADLLNRAILFIGYSFRDYNVSYLFRIMTDALAQSSGSMAGPRAYIVSPDPSDFEFHLFRNRSIEVISINSARLTDDTAEFLRDLRS